MVIKMTIQINISKACQSWGECVFDAPEVFHLVNSERDTWEYYASNELIEKIQLATNNCPNSAISFKVIDDKTNNM